MIINCPSCNKKFEIDKNLIPFEGRLLQCGSCNHKWLFKPENIKDEIEIIKKTTTNLSNENNINLTDEVNNNLFTKENETKTISEIPKQEFKNKKNVKIKFNFFKVLIVLIISFIALIIVLDTFKSQISIIVPNIEIILDNLYQSLNDIRLFVLDLVK